jgi:DNA-directed RNA polymerase specialized sigma24 family protein
MPKSQLVAQHVPYLRRYARALTGSQASGDSYVVAALEALVKEPTVLGEDLNPRWRCFGCSRKSGIPCP